MFLTKIDGGYVVETLTEKGESLLELGEFEQAGDAQIEAAAAANQAALDNCPEKLNGTEEEIRKKVREEFDNPIWDKFAEDCFSCGSCNLVCSTCYCFDVQDEWNIDGASGCRFRVWDACLNREFSEVTSPAGIENFRATRGMRYRHRFMRKAAYLNDMVGGPACIGCGRCSGSCTADIANPVTVINKILEL
jgi:ferredoxin